jgi:3-oxoacyl-[acyl-carrier-protein] synthase II
MSKDVVITGIGLVSSLGLGAEEHWKALMSGKAAPVTDSDSFAPYTIHRLPEIDWNTQIPRRGDQRQMETWQRLGTYTAGLALEDSGIKDNEELCSTMDMVVAAGGGERDTEVDNKILSAAETRNDRELLLNEVLTTDLRPTLFLAQLSNLLAGNISIVHKVTGSSRTFMGDGSAGISAVDTSISRIRSGQSTHALVGGSFQTEHPDMLLNFALDRMLAEGPWAPLWRRDGVTGGGLVPGSGAAFLVLESADHARSRGAHIYASLGNVRSSFTNRASCDLVAAVRNLAGDANGKLIISGASGAKKPTRAEYDALSSGALRGFSGLTGYLKEAQFPFAIALAAMAVNKGDAYPSFDPEAETDFGGPVESVLVTSIGSYIAEGMVDVSKAGA